MRDIAPVEPYFGLRDYGEDGQIGLEATLPEYVARLVEVFAEVHRVLRPDGTLWLNLGDSYATRWASTRDVGGKGLNGGQRTRTGQTRDGFQKKDQMGVPWRVAFALQDAGWILSPRYAQMARDRIREIASAPRFEML